MEDRGENLSAGSLSSSQFDSKIWHEVDGMGGPESYEVNINYPPLFNEADFGGDGRPVSGDRAALGMVDFRDDHLEEEPVLRQWYDQHWHILRTASFLFDQGTIGPPPLAILFILEVRPLDSLFAVIIPPH